MGKKITVVRRITPDLDAKIDNIAKKNNFSYPQASGIVAKQLDEFEFELKKCKKSFKLDLKF